MAVYDLCNLCMAVRVMQRIKDLISKNNLKLSSVSLCFKQSESMVFF